MEGRRRGVRRTESQNGAPRATDLGIAIRYGDSPPSLEIQNSTMLTDAHTGASASNHTELPPAYVERTPCLPTYDLVMSMRRRQHSVRRSNPNHRQSSLPAWLDSNHRQRRRNEETVSRRREMGRVEAMIRQERQRPMREREESHERRVQQQQARLDMGSPLGAFRENEAQLGLDLNDQEMDVLLRAFGVPAY
ncbi:hypothetical protein CPB83DRAFT_850719 [Crepidotus variabilis]|uniref:Uncharacterized protein n=1 Tax=Crepidotus variabilis TaxID=179855 RepID=A0A9P6EJN2_9AGAR|nr:hypothetical protein CPB83DRAFT_850719 [Crepidotus variabilis]